MGRIKNQPPVKLIVGLIFKENPYAKRALVFLKKYFGAIDFQSTNLVFNHTDYYQKEFGKCLKRQFIAFKKLIPAESLAKIKNITNKIEGKLVCGSQRLVNIDPGYLDFGKLVLASTKDHRHRIYLRQGIFAEASLFFENHTFKPWGHTYPDYASSEYIKIFNQIREIYAKQIAKK